MMKRKILFYGFISFIFFIGCKEDAEENKGQPYDPSKPIVLERFLPETGGVGTKLIIAGDNFGNDKNLVKVKVNGKNAPVVNVIPTRIYAIVPSRADTGKIEVFVGDTLNVQTRAFEKDFIYIFKQNVSTISGQTNVDGNGDVVDGTLDNAWYRRPEWITMDTDGVMFLLEETGGLRIINQSEDRVTTPFRVGGALGRVRTACFTATQDTMYISHDTWDSNGIAIFTVTRNNGFMNIKPLAYGMTCNFCAINPVDGEIFYNKYSTAVVLRYDKTKPNEGVVVSTNFDQSTEMHGIFTPDGKYMYLVCRNKHTIFRLTYDFQTKSFRDAVPFAGPGSVTGNNAGFANGVGEAARFNYPCQPAIDEHGYLFVADKSNHCIRQISPEGVVTTFAGVPGVKGYLDGEPTEALFNSPEGLYYNVNEGAFYVADYDNHRIRRIIIE
ncbi:MAG: IPT/TIG domain-containing protein [Dysgonamonadaceae bacterium]|jgi:sugar lactone lactonase YvrE|nr:IPT/TIG domain-containing protein [Dysgonamonadaceae bacterium]